jgi:hypothetical protein
MTINEELIRHNGFNIPKTTSEMVKNYLYILSRNGAVIYRPSEKENLTEEFVSIANRLNLTVFANDDGIAVFNEKGDGGQKKWQ